MDRAVIVWICSQTATEDVEMEFKKQSLFNLNT